MKIPCPVCGKPIPRNKLILVKGLRIRDKVARVCSKCFEKQDKDHQAEYEEEYGEETGQYMRHKVHLGDGGYVTACGVKFNKAAELDHSIVWGGVTCEACLALSEVGDKKHRKSKEPKPSCNGPRSTIFAPLGATLDQDTTALISICLLPAGKILDALSEITYTSLETGETHTLGSGFVGVTGGLEDVKACICRVLEDLWKSRGPVVAKVLPEACEER